MHVGTVDAADLDTAPASAVLICAAPEVPFTTALIFSLHRHIEAGGTLLLLLQSQPHKLMGNPERLATARAQDFWQQTPLSF